MDRELWPDELPTEDEVRAAWVEEDRWWCSIPRAHDRFNRWLRSVQAAAFADGAETADQFVGNGFDAPNPYLDAQ